VAQSEFCKESGNLTSAIVNSQGFGEFRSLTDVYESGLSRKLTQDDIIPRIDRLRVGISEQESIGKYFD
jgi:hypothetical protein